ncbi:hypothetical protein [Lapillicoccus sp.]|uniref:hypothetical protein n=1 Tax=Lapillicoccus sp. TaxID=1909287 RepID=UPI0025FC9D2C|nr:hypothetical protein [Lapillicoccus sp.]
MSAATSRDRTREGVVTVHELKRAWLALERGQFRQRRIGGSRTVRVHPVLQSRAPGADAAWQAVEPVLPVVGCAGSVGASTLALALATAASSPDTGAGRTRVVECCSVTASGLAAATTAELGPHSSGWVQGTRGEVLLERVVDAVRAPDEVPLPSIEAPYAVSLTVLDVGWEVGLLLENGGWLSDQLRRAPHVVAVARATVPGLRRLEGVLAMLDGTSVTAAVLEPRPPIGRLRGLRGIESSMGARTRELDRDGRVHHILLDPLLAHRGLDSQPLPAPLLSAAQRLLAAATAAPNPSAQTKGRPQ